MMYDLVTDPCILWQGPTCGSGRYGRTDANSVEFMAHREAYRLKFGDIPPGMVICHKCDNGLCVNTNHLFLGTQSDNMKDAYAKGRIPTLNCDQSGENNYNAKYTKEFAEEVREYYKVNKPTFSELARVFNLKSKGHAHAIVKYKIWK